MNDQARADVKRLRLAYAAAIAATKAARDTWIAGHVSYRQNLKNRHAHERAIELEINAGREFLGALDAADPACVSCGCTTFNACQPPCAWVSVHPPLCSACHTAASS